MASKRIRQEVHTRYCEVAVPANPLRLTCGRELPYATIGYEMYGELNERKDNAILLFHALSGSAHAAGLNTEGHPQELWTKEMEAGWWDDFVGPGRAFDTSQYCVICANYLGSCYGTTGPRSINPDTGRPWASSFPPVSVTDIVESQIRLLDKLGVETLVCAAGGSMGGFCAMDLAVRYPDRIRCVIPIATGLRATVLAKALNFEQIFAIQEDADFRAGEYYDGPSPDRGLILARMISHKTFVSLSLMEQRARSEIVQPENLLASYHLRHKIESYMLHQGRKFAKRFDANSYLRIIGAWQDFDLPRQHAKGDAAKALKACRGQHWLIFTINSDVCFYPDEQAEVASALKASGVDYQHITVHSEKGHDSFLLEPDLYAPYISYKIQQVYREHT